MERMKKLYDYLLMLFCAVLIFLVVSVFVVGWDLIANKNTTTTKEIEIALAEVQIVGKAYDASMRISGSGGVYFADCNLGLRQLCNIYHGRTLYAKKIKLLDVNNARSKVLLYGEFKSDGEKYFIIDNLSDSQYLAQQSIEGKWIYPKFFFWASVVMLPFVLLGRFVLGKSLNANKSK
ncbi:hypothetical protein [Neisseria sp.]|uniref:hypothetical protein n=1 Tax=Neisseria sp. TaxID=192066 RepID=UPI0028A1B6E2|nr:hypothetical protein [Neisseria sp.]